MAQARGEARRQAIVDAAVTLFATHGYRGTSVAAVAEIAGVTDAGVLYHFRTKADLLLAVLLAHDERYATMLRESADDELERVRTWGEVMERDVDLTALLVTLSAEHLRDESETNRYFRARYDAVRRRYVAMFESAVAAGALRDDVDAEAEAVHLIALMDGLRLQWFFSDGRISIADAVRRHVDLTLERLSR
ncbi:MAG TPA: TetR family transcriptional regulator [Acidimicrobiales bacterium]|nr:TetR family transcriptional regulator [Acidimicrobiales bacterium]